VTSKDGKKDIKKMIDEKDLIQRIAKGEQDAFIALMDQYQNFVFRMILGLVGDVDDAEELTQDVFVKVFFKIKQFKQESSFKTWLYVIVKNTVRNYRIKQKIWQTVTLNWEHIETLADHRESLEEGQEKKEHLSEINQAMATLPFKVRHILVLREVNALSYLEIAAVLKCSVGTVKSQLSRAKVKLAAAYDKLQNSKKERNSICTIPV